MVKATIYAAHAFEGGGRKAVFAVDLGSDLRRERFNFVHLEFGRLCHGLKVSLARTQTHFIL